MKANKKKRKSFASVFPMITILGMSIISLCSYYEPDWHFDWNGIRPEIKDTILVAKNHSIDDRYTGYAGRISNQYLRQQWLMNHASAYELQKLTEYPNGAVKAIAYSGLFQNASVKDKTSIALKAIQDTVSKIYYTSGCTGDQMNLSQYIMENMLFNNMYYSSGTNGELREEYNFTVSQKEKILTTYSKVQNLSSDN